MILILMIKFALIQTKIKSLFLIFASQLPLFAGISGFLLILCLPCMKVIRLCIIQLKSLLYKPSNLTLILRSYIKVEEEN